jgi:signal transduction histidine kinase
MLHRRLVLAIAAREQERKGQRTAIDIVIGSLAHELRQPLTSILVNGSAGSKLLAAEPADREEVAAVFADIRGSVLRADEIIASVRSMFAASPTERGAIDVGALATEAVELMRIELETHRIGVDLRLATGLPPIYGHRGQLLEVMLNGLKNGLDSLESISDRPRELQISTAALAEDRVFISIEDSGSGIDPRMHNRLFEPFHSTKPGGTGLGLSICRSIVVAHGGALSLKPGLTHGAVLRIELPASAVASAPGGDLLTSPMARALVDA